MKQCVKITVLGKVQEVSYRKFVQESAQKLGIEGTVQNIDDSKKRIVVINACGLSDKLDELIDCLYEGTKKSEVEDVQVEPLLIKKDFRGVFRIIGN